MFIWKVLISQAVHFLEDHGRELVEDTKTPFDDLTLEALLKVLKVLQMKSIV